MFCGTMVAERQATVKTFNPTSKNPARAVQAWQILVGMAKNRQTVTYEGLSELMYQKKAAGVLDKILGHIAYYCGDNQLPPLETLVVGKRRGKPGRGIPVDPIQIDAKREEVYQYNRWYDIYPSEEHFAAAYARHAH
jgi:hypothetical protein